MQPTCTEHHEAYPCTEECQEFRCNGCNWNVSRSTLEKVSKHLVDDGLDPDDGLMCAECYLDI
jgi:hypothetical protein